MALQLALHASHPCRIVLIGRNAASASSTISLMRASQKASHEYSFEACDVSAFKNVRRTTEILNGRLDKVDLLVLTAGFLTMRGRSWPLSVRAAADFPVTGTHGEQRD